MKRISILLIALLAFVVAACSSGEASQSASATPPPATAEPTASETTEPSQTSEPNEAPGASGSAAAIPSFDTNGDPDLAGRFPDTVGGEPLSVRSFRGDTFAAMGGSDPAFDEFLDSVGADLEDVSVAFGGSAAGTTALAFRVLGASEDDLEREFIAASEDAGDVSGLEESSVGGKDVWTAADPSGETTGSAFIYVKDDTVYFLTGTEEQAAEILSALP
ncbi:MAG: hypothetical protein H0W41_00755 [Chloroflexi bacterium]|nr:hypothetical protein [Chloroflexota bacterium]